MNKGILNNFLIDREKKFLLNLIILGAEYSREGEVFGSFYFEIISLYIRGPPSINLDKKI